MFCQSSHPLVPVPLIPLRYTMKPSLTKVVKALTRQAGFLATISCPGRNLAMQSPPVVRLSQALYSDVPSPVQIRSAARLSSRKRGHSGGAATGFELESTAVVVRLLLPRTFPVADRAYHARGRNSATEKVEDNTGREIEAGIDGCPRCCEDAAVQQQDSLLGTGIEGDTPGDDTARQAVCSSSTSTSKTLGGPPHYPLRILETGSEGVLMVVVESVLGFSAVRALLEQSIDTSGTPIATSGDDQTPEHSGCTSGADRSCRGKGADKGVGEALGRLVGWLKIAWADEELRRGHGDEGVDERRSTRRGELSKKDNFVGDDSNAGIRGGAGQALLARKARQERDAASNIFDDDDLLSAAAVAVAATSVVPHDAPHEVTRRCEGSLEWSDFTLEAADRAAQEAPSKRPWAGTRGSTSSGARTLQVMLICHPLVTMAPDIRWCLRLIGQAQAIASLLNANAKLSTLGGGYFLTRQVGQAIRLARAQSEVATALGDMNLAGKCRVNEAYNYIWLGQYDQAQRIIDAQLAASRTCNDEELRNVAAIAARFLRRSKKANRRLLKIQLHASQSADGGSSGGQGWVQQRIDVKTDEWHRVRALPMYYSSSGRAAS